MFFVCIYGRHKATIQHYASHQYVTSTFPQLVLGNLVSRLHEGGESCLVYTSMYHLKQSVNDYVHTI